jgi:FAD/FMN-containing dehydrogenase
MSIDTRTARRFSGDLILRGQDGYEHARTAHIYHARHPERFPAAVLLAQTEQDVVEGVRLARERGWKVGIKSGGHSFAVSGVRDDGLLIDLADLSEMSYNPETGIVSVTPAVRGGQDLNPYLEQFGVFFPSGNCSSVGVGGFLLQGGIGWNFRGWGWSAEQIAAIDVVTADGELVRADDDRNADLFWAARGAGPGYCGAITRFHLRTRPLPRGLSSMVQGYRVEDYADVLEWLCAQQHTISGPVHLMATSGVPQFPIPGHSDGELLFHVWAVAFCDSEEDSRAALAPLTGGAFADRTVFTIDPHPTTLHDEHAFVDSSCPSGYRYRVDSAWVEGSSADIVAASRRLVLDRPSNDQGHTFFQYALPHEGPDIAMSLKTDVMVTRYVIYEDPANDDTYRDFLLSAMGDLEPLTVGRYWGDSDPQTRRVKCLTDANWARLQQIRTARDRDGVFVDYLAGKNKFDNTNGWEALTAESTPRRNPDER